MAELPATLEEAKAWRCPECGAPLARVDTENETVREGVTPEDKRLAAYGLEPNQSRYIIVASHYTFTCDNGHAFQETRTEA